MKPIFILVLVALIALLTACDGQPKHLEEETYLLELHIADSTNIKKYNLEVNLLHEYSTKIYEDVSLGDSIIYRFDSTYVWYIVDNKEKIN